MHGRGVNQREWKMSSQSKSMRERPYLATRLLKPLALSAAAMLFLGLWVAGITWLHLRTAAEALPQQHPPTTVQTLRLEMRSHYRETVRYVGQPEPARQTALAFERGGRVTTVSTFSASTCCGVYARVDVDKSLAGSVENLVATWYLLDRPGGREPAW